jgi:hypothetical protein
VLARMLSTAMAPVRVYDTDVAQSAARCRAGRRDCSAARRRRAAGRAARTQAPRRRPWTVGAAAAAARRAHSQPQAQRPTRVRAAPAAPAALPACPTRGHLCLPARVHGWPPAGPAVVCRMAAPAGHAKQGLAAWLKRSSVHCVIRGLALLHLSHSREVMDSARLRERRAGTPARLAAPRWSAQPLRRPQHRCASMPGALPPHTTPSSRCCHSAEWQCLRAGACCRWLRSCMRVCRGGLHMP